MARNASFSPYLFNKMQNFPPLTATGSNNGRNWCAWKQNFLFFLQREDPKELYKNQWSNILLMLIGPFGKQAYKDLFSQNNPPKDLESLLCNLDLYFIFGLKKKQKDENISKYIDSLMLIAIASNHSDPVSIVKEKLIQNIKCYNFSGKAMFFIQSKGIDLVSYLQLLDLHKITLFWEHCEELMSQKTQNIPEQVLPDSQTKMECIRCGGCHSRNKCPAYGVRCDNCKGYNHYKEKCKVKYVHNCTKCGTDHVQSRCPAYGESCTKCGKPNHFPWLCQVPIAKNCFRCGKDHAMSACPAQGKICSRCNKPNHLTEKCVSKLNDEE